MNRLRAAGTGTAILTVGVASALVVSLAAAQPRGTANDSPVTSLAGATSGSAPSATDTTTATALRPSEESSSTRARITAPRIAGTPVPTSARPTVPRRSGSHPQAASRSPAPARATAALPTTQPATHPAVRSVASPVRGGSLPLGFATGTASQVITVVAPSSGSTTATVQAWYRAAGGGWLRRGSAIAAHVGSQGVTSHPSETLSATPIGSFTLTQAFGRAANPGTALPYFQTGPADWWVSDTSSSLYNTHQRCTSCPFNTAVSENLYDVGYVYTYAVVIDYNRFPAISGAGSAFFLHVTDGSATAGCVAVPAGSLVSLMAWLTPTAHPRILIGVA